MGDLKEQACSRGEPQSSRGQCKAYHRASRPTEQGQVEKGSHHVSHQHEGPPAKLP